MTNDEARKVYAESGLTYNDVYDCRKILAKEIQSAIDKSRERGGSLPMKVFSGGRRMERSTRNVECFFLRVNGPYFDDRECVSFNPDGFVGFAGWADSWNTAPVLEGFVKALAIIKARKEGA
jgi:hypothetical protein